jgi:hypothetical protein
MWIPTITRRSVYFLVAAVTLAMLSSCSKPVPIATTTEAERVAAAFDVLSKGAQLKDGLPPMKLNPKLAARSLLPDGAKVALWVASAPARPALSRCFYLDFSSSKSKSTTGTSSCGGPTEQISLNRLGSLVIGDIGSWPATRVLVAIPGSFVDLPVTESYFLVPSSLAGNPSDNFRVTLLDAIRDPFAVVDNLSAPGSGAPAVRAGLTASQQLKSVLSPCPAASDRKSQAMPKNVFAAAYNYYRAKHLLPVSIDHNRADLLTLNEQSLGLHSCNSGGGVIGGYQGEVPLNATQAVMVFVKHAPYKDGTGATANFLTVAMIPGKGWQVVGENTGP